MDAYREVPSSTKTKFERHKNNTLVDKNKTIILIITTPTWSSNVQLVGTLMINHNTCTCNCYIILFIKPLDHGK